MKTMRENCVEMLKECKLKQFNEDREEKIIAKMLCMNADV
jgi:hypothetical protein